MMPRRYERSYLRVSDAIVSAAMARSLNPEYLEHHFVGELVRTRDGDWIVVLEPDMRKELERSMEAEAVAP